MSQRFEVDVWAATAVGEATNVVDLAALGVNLCDGFKVFGLEAGTRKEAREKLIEAVAKRGYLERFLKVGWLRKGGIYSVPP